MKKTAIGFFIVISTLILVFRLGVTKVHSAYGNVLFSEDFDTVFDNTWYPRHFSGTNTSSHWNISDGKYGMEINENGQTGNSISGSNSWTDYAYELDMYPYSGSDRNFVFRYQKDNISSTKDKFYEVHATSNGVLLGKAYGQAITISSNYKIENNKAYRWRIELIGNKIKVLVKELNESNFTEILNYTDNNSPYLYGNIGVRVGAGADYPSKVYFDNILVYDLTGPTPTPTPPPPTPTMTPAATPTPLPPTPTPSISVPYYSQRDITWKDDSYDFLSRTIEEVGCALTSAVMVLRHHGLDKLPLNNQLVDLNPRTLNQWLNLPENTDGWWRDGSMSWGALTRLAKTLHDDYSQDYSKLEYEIIASDSADLQNTIITDRDPLIFKYLEPNSPTSTHFVVGYGIGATNSGSLYTIHDPWETSRTQLAVPPTDLKRAGHFYKTSSDLSYIFINADEALTLTLKDPTNQYLGPFSKEYSLINKLNPNIQTGNPYWHLPLKYPVSGQYLLQAVASTPGVYRYEIYAYNREGQFEVVKKTIYFDANVPQGLILDYSHDGLPVLTANPVSYTGLRALILAVYNNGLLNLKTSQQFLRHLDVSEKVYPKDPEDGVKVLNTLKTHFGNSFRQAKLLNPGYSQLEAEINLLLDTLMLN